MKACAGDYTRKLFPKTTDREKGEVYNTTSFFINIGAQSLNFQMSATVRIMPGELSCAQVGHQHGGPGANSLSIPRVTQEEAVPLECIW